MRDLAFAEEFCRRLGVPLTVERRDVPEFARKNRLGLEEAARAFRYEVFRRILSEGKADAVATAHHLNDEAETVLFRLARGTSPSGMSAFTQKAGILRPMLGVTRAEIDDYIRQNALPFVEDSTNADERYARNKIRKEVLPALEKVNPLAAKHLVNFALASAEDDELLTSLALEKITADGEAFLIPLDLPMPLFSRASVEIMKRLGIEKDYTHAHVVALKNLTVSESGSMVSLPRGAVAAKEGERVAFYLPMDKFEGEIPYHGWGEYRLGMVTAIVREQDEEGALAIDPDKIPDGCVLRTRRQGDEFTPYHGQKKSLKEFLTDRKIPARVGKTLPLLAKDGEILAVFGVEIADRVRITEQTERIGYLFTPVRFPKKKFQR